MYLVKIKKTLIRITLKQLNKILFHSQSTIYQVTSFQRKKKLKYFINNRYVNNL